MALNEKSKKLDELELRLKEYGGDDRVVSSHELRDMLGEQPAAKKISLGVPYLDRVLNNVEAGELVVVTGPTGHGKTTLLMSITQNLSIKGTRSVWFTLEVTPRQFIEKISVNGELPIFYTPAKNTENHVQWLIERIIEAKVKYDVQAVFIDHLHQIFSIERFQNKSLSLELGDVVAKIKQLAIEYALSVFLIAHSTDDKNAPTREPKMMDIRDSGLISRLADVVIGVWRIPNDQDGTSRKMFELREEDTRAKVAVWKNRREGKLGFCLMNHLNHRLLEIDLRNKYEYD